MMSFRNRMLGLTAGTLLLGCFSSTAQAQTDVLTLGTLGVQPSGGLFQSLYTFTSQKIVTQIGFVGYDSDVIDYFYGINDGSMISVAKTDLTTHDSNGLKWFTFTRTFESGETLRVYNGGAVVRNATYTVTPGTTGVRYDGIKGVLDSSRSLSTTNSNIRVSNPGSNVAPEPGSFALALTGGAALIGICIRRRRNAS